jgi:hypothetical protein
MTGIWIFCLLLQPSWCSHWWASRVWFCFRGTSKSWPVANCFALIRANLRQKKVFLCAPLRSSVVRLRVAFAVSGPFGLRGSAVAG